MLPLRPTFGLGLLVTSLLLCFLLGTTTSATCENCSVSTPCEQVRCTAQGVCEHYPTDPAPAGCCRSDADCAEGFAEATDLQPCLQAHCDLSTFTCTNIWDCMDTYPPPPDLSTCETNDDCVQYTTYCNQAVCVAFDPPTCDTRPINRTLPTGCCTHKRDCLEVACMDVDCDIDYSMCIYVEQENCGSGVTATTTPSTVPSPSPTSIASTSPLPMSESASPQPSVADPSPIASITATPSMSSSASVSAAPSSEPSSTQSPSASSSASAASSLTSMSPSLSSTPSVSSTIAASIAATASSSASISELAISASASLSFSPTASTEDVGVAPLPGTHPDSGGSGLMTIVVVLVVVVIVLFLIGLVVAGLVLRQRYMNDKFQAIDLIDDEEFPM